MTPTRRAARGQAPRAAGSAARTSGAKRTAGSSAARARSFPPLIAPAARVLILGSMPGAASLAAGQYYAHPYNQFWRILGALCGARADLAYPLRLQRLRAHGIALWDVLESCVRPGSLDSAIEHASALANDIPGLLRAAPRIRRICCNGASAYESVRRYHGDELDALGITVLRLPSTSPANAAWSFARKLAAWRAALEDGGRNADADGSGR
ncbi:MAG TPA: DNA-deoxyinosine glycosylase [Steroidobacteraceae bacterium]|nr:DNA-deoxyinosine glycosylase [Steroidobacteraceae bacterium]